ncbi:uncharacterized protein LOC111451538 [Cucurbita moschata]|uniref:Uncharacterized protein LOC111451538 n=1 Tax=Cucurbita moschata TaxID=3662 RepID=A0A6J1G7W6_CUCMO|nr:uncharacterized protein LOC111451538 [Cucurbita moschata]
MFGIFFGWRKASKCKKLIKQVQCRLKLLKNKKGIITKQMKEDVVQLIRNGYDQTAFSRVEQIVKDENRVAAYEILDNFCEFILLNLSYIRKHRDCPNDVNEAVSSLMFAAARCGDLPELQHIRKLFGERYGRRFESSAVQLGPGNLVNCQIKEKLLINSVSDDDKQRMMNEIARDCLQPQLLALQYRSDWHQNQVVARIAKADEKPDQHINQANSGTSSSCDSLPQFPEERIVYLDDVVELCSSTNIEGDQRLFKFKTAATLPKTEITQHNSNQTDTDRTESRTDIENPSSKISIKGSMGTEGKHQIKGKNFTTVQNGSEGATDKEMEWASFYKKPGRRRTKRSELPSSSDLSSTTYDVFTYNGNKKVAANDTKSNAMENCEEMKLPSSLRNKREALYLRAETMPPERPKESQRVNFCRTNSCPDKKPTHVHPKLPDYDDIAAKFMALRRQHLQNNTLKS